MHRAPLLLIALGLAAAPAAAAWVEFVEQTAARLNVADPALVRSDVEEKNYAWADFDRDGDTDLVIFRKEPFLVAGKLRNVLLLNEDGVLTDRTAELASTADLAGDQGFLTPTNDRDVVAADLDLDGWIDLVTVATISPGEPKSVGHPRIYMNLGCEGACDGTEDWLGFEYQDARIPAMLSWAGQADHNPCFCDVAVGDVTGDGYPDLWMADYDLGCSVAATDFESRLLVNRGAAAPGHFTDETLARFIGQVGGEPFPVNVNSLSGAIADLNGDELPEVVLESEGLIDFAYHDGAQPFDLYDSETAFSAYFMNVADLNNDGMLDLITTDDGLDRYYLNQGAQGAPVPVADWISYGYTYQHSGTGGPAADDGFGDETIAVDLDRDGWPDVLTFDVDFELVGCNRRAHIYRNLGGQPGDQVLLREETTGSACSNFLGNPPTCVVASIPADRLVGTYDIAVFDIDGDGWDDLVIGTCSGTEIYMNVPQGTPARSAQTLTLAQQGGSIVLGWGASCSLADNDYAVYAGPLDGGFSGHAAVACSTGGATMLSFEPETESRYYLVVPSNGSFEGSYGAASSGAPRGQAAEACLPMYANACD